MMSYARICIYGMGLYQQFFGGSILQLWLFVQNPDLIYERRRHKVRWTFLCRFRPSCEGVLPKRCPPIHADGRVRSAVLQ